MKIVLDIYGGDNAPEEIVKGAVLGLNEVKNLELILTGNEEVIKELLSKEKVDMSRIEIVDAKEVVTNDDVPTDAIKFKKESSLVKGLEITKERDDVAGIVSAGSTGALLAGGIFKIGRNNKILRPSLAPILPTLTGGNTCLIDGGANVDSKPEFLVQFALMGVAYMRSVYGVKNPRVAIVSVGTEDKKGNELTKATFKLLKELPINFVGNMEARDVLTGEYDVLVCDGFVGNVLLKSCEGAVAGMMKLVKGAMMSNFKSKIGGMLVKKELKKSIKNLRLDDNGGAAFLGLKKLLLKSHGSAKANEIRASLVQICKMAEVDLVGKIANEFDAITDKE